MLYLVRHGRPVLDPAAPASTWELDPAGYDDVWALRDRLPQGAAWYSSPEPKAVQTAQLLTDHEVGVLEGLREHHRGTAWLAGAGAFEAAVGRAFEHPDEPAVEGWEPLADCRDRVLGAVGPVLDAHAGEDVVMVGHVTAWTFVVAGLTGRAPDLGRWRASTLPDVLEVAGR